MYVFKKMNVKVWIRSMLSMRLILSFEHTEHLEVKERIGLGGVMFGNHKIYCFVDPSMDEKKNCSVPCTDSGQQEELFYSLY